MLFRLFDLQAVSRIRQTTDGGVEPRVFVFAGSMDKFEDDVFSQFPYQFSFMGPFIRICGFPIHEVRDYSIVLVGHQADIDRVLSDDFSLLQAHIVAYPKMCPQCGSAILPIAAACGEVNWDGICKKCSTVYMVSNGDLFVYDVKTQWFVNVGSKAALTPSTSGQLMVDEPECPPYSNQARFGTPYKSAISICDDVSSKLPGFAHDSEPESPDPPPKTWRQLPPLF